MQLDELKKNMSTLDQILAKTQTEIKIDVKSSQTAQGKLLKHYRNSILANSILAIVFACQLPNPEFTTHLPKFYVAFIALIGAAATLWYIFLYMKLDKIKISQLSPTKLFSKTTKLKILTISGQMVSVVVLAVFFTLLLSHMLITNPLAFRLIIATLAFGLIWGAIYTWPRYIKLFRDLNSIK